MEGEPCGAQWHPVDLRTGAPWADGSLSVVSHLPPAVSAVGPRRRAAEHPRSPRSGTARPRLHGSAEAFIDGSFAPAKQKALAWARRNAARDRRSWPLPIARGSRRRPRGERHAARSHTCARHTRAPICRSAAGASHPLQRLRVGQAGRGTGAPWRGADRATPEDRNTANARRSPAALLSTAVEGRAPLCLVPELRWIERN